MMMNIILQISCFEFDSKNIVYYFPPLSLNLNLCAQHLKDDDEKDKEKNPSCHCKYSRKKLEMMVSRAKGL